ncbi:MAG: hypothetical protein U0872_15555, partial [Planctomycetaceae bacterium]
QLQNGRLTGFDEGDQTLTFRVGEEEVRVPLDQLDDVQLEPANEAHQPTSELSTMQISYHDGTCVTGVWLGTDGQQIALLPRGTLSAVCAPLTGVRAISFLQTRSTLGESREAPARLELAETRLPGRLVDGDERPDASCLTWLPDGSEKAAPLRKQAAGKIVFRTPPAAAATKARSDAAANRRPMAAPVLDIGKIINRNTVKTPKPAGNPGKFLHLRHGDVIPCEVKSIDERGVTIETPLSAATFVGHDQIKAVELIKSKGTPKLARLKRERLLTLPRMQKDLPPAQLLYSVGSSGDFLRGRIMEMDAETIQVEVRQEVRRIPRSRVAQIIWLPADELEQDSSAAVPEQQNRADDTTRVQAIRTDGIRLTVLARRLSNGLLIGQNDVLGECRTDVQQADQLVIGAEIERSTAKLAYARWKLHHAPEPKFVQEESGELPSGTDSPLVGRPAPDFTLPFLDGSEFKLSESRGKSGGAGLLGSLVRSCLQAMPQVEQVVSEFPEASSWLP